MDKNTKPSRYEPQRDVEQAVNAKIRVLKDFYIVDSRNEAAIRGWMWAEIHRRQGVDFDTVLDSFAKKLISEKLG